MKNWLSLLLLAVLTLSVGAASAVAASGVAIDVPQGYVQGEPLPLYRATARTQEQAGFISAANPAWFNPGGQAPRENQDGAGYSLVVFTDEARLGIGESYIEYGEYEGVHRMYYADAPDEPAGPFPRPALINEIAALAGNAYYESKRNGVPAALKHTELSGVTLDDARRQVDDLFEKLGVGGYECVFALDMSLPRIRELGAAETKQRAKHKNKSDGWWDFSLAAQADEGFYLRYEKRLSGAPVRDEVFYAEAYVTASGIRDFALREDYAAGEIALTPARLITAAEALAAFECGNARREKHLLLNPTATGARLMYMPVRAQNRKEGMVFAPVWYVSYTFEDGVPCDGWAFYSAVDGSLIEDCYT